MFQVLYLIAVFACLGATANFVEYFDYDSGYIGVYTGSDSITVNTGYSYCEEEFGTTLASIHNSNDNSKAVSAVLLAGSASRIFIGLNSKNSGGTWQWSDGTSVDYTNWGYGEPNNWYEKCVEINPYSGYNTSQWNDISCNNSYSNGFVCNINSNSNSNSNNNNGDTTDSTTDDSGDSGNTGNTVDTNDEEANTNGNNNSSGDLDITALVGIGGVLIVVFIICLYCYRKNKNKKNENLKSNLNTQQQSNTQTKITIDENNTSKPTTTTPATTSAQETNNTDNNNTDSNNETNNTNDVNNKTDSNNNVNPLLDDIDSDKHLAVASNTNSIKMAIPKTTDELELTETDDDHDSEDLYLPKENVVTPNGNELLQDGNINNNNDDDDILEYDGKTALGLAVAEIAKKQENITPGAAAVAAPGDVGDGYGVTGAVIPSTGPGANNINNLSNKEDDKLYISDNVDNNNNNNNNENGELNKLQQVQIRTTLGLLENDNGGENSVQHGMNDDGGIIDELAMEDDDVLELAIEGDGPALPDENINNSGNIGNIENNDNVAASFSYQRFVSNSVASSMDFGNHAIAASAAYGIPKNENDILSEAIGKIRKAIVRSKKEIRKIKDEEEKSEHSKTVKVLTKIINKGIGSIEENDRSVILQVYEAIKDSNDDDLGLELLDVLETMDLE